MKKLIIKKERLATINSEDNFIYAVQLARILGAISYYTILNVKINSDPAVSGNLKSHFYLSHGALLYESIKTLYEMKSSIEGLTFYGENIKEFEDLFARFQDPNGFIKRVLGKMRDRVAFHFDKRVVKEQLEDYFKGLIESGNEVVLIQGESEALKDTTYDLADDMNLNYVLREIDGSTKSFEENFKAMAEQFFSLMGLVRNLMEGLLGDLAEPYCEMVEK
jgi:hypothetical protein